MNQPSLHLSLFLPVLLACEPPPEGGPQGAAEPTSTTPTASGGCVLTANTTAGAAHGSGCALLTRDTSGCRATREASGLSGFWLDLSCRVELSVDGDVVVAEADGLPDHLSNYFNDGDACHEAYTSAIQNPNLISTQEYAVRFPRTADSEPTNMGGTAVVGLALNGVAIFGNFAAPGDDIFEEARTFDRCAGHPQNRGVYHYHSEPYSITQDDASFVGVMRDGSPIYGRRDQDGSLPELDAYGGHTGITPHSDTPVYHYHVHSQTSSGGETQWFLTSGWFRGTPGSCDGC